MPSRSLAKSFTSLTTLELARTEKLGMGVSGGEETDNEMKCLSKERR